MNFPVHIGVDQTVSTIHSLIHNARARARLKDGFYSTEERALWAMANATALASLTPVQEKGFNSIVQLVSHLMRRDSVILTTDARKDEYYACFRRRKIPTSQITILAYDDILIDGYAGPETLVIVDDVELATRALNAHGLDLLDIYRWSQGPEHTAPDRTFVPKRHLYLLLHHIQPVTETKPTPMELSLT